MTLPRRIVFDCGVTTRQHAARTVSLRDILNEPQRSCLIEQRPREQFRSDHRLRASSEDALQVTSAGQQRDTTECVEHLYKLLKGDNQIFVPFGFILASVTCP
ncbi:uncharacterized protein L969DRAFT_83752 [Mixia osmundae IAM 14324]|uniref:uncharacterized protein n=1 Tax=Mixia osmundae (strain CBS 9802 / IAM 14324 / JCM 22182 / KY 12970) TaxID=764103 RepID=UPI0004A558E2|nr:uncharacterized protein L969DRAFT_83752 [Mixia osmundae IAM 14324]KEI41890.1 hypothetical protein L969DRAFT_83752 [Mixia osmundae IAM 14324]